jgi:hypothetical protein
MTKLMEKAVQIVRLLPPESQDEIAHAMLSLAGMLCWLNWWMSLRQSVPAVGYGPYGRGYLMDASFDSIEMLFAHPCKWAQRWLMDFRDDPDDNFMVVPFGDHWQQQYAALKGAIDEPRPLLLPSPNPSPALNPAPQ